MGRITREPPLIKKLHSEEEENLASPVEPKEEGTKSLSPEECEALKMAGLTQPSSCLFDSKKTQLKAQIPPREKKITEPWVGSITVRGKTDTYKLDPKKGLVIDSNGKVIGIFRFSPLSETEVENQNHCLLEISFGGLLDETVIVPHSEKDIKAQVGNSWFGVFDLDAKKVVGGFDISTYTPQKQRLQMVRAWELVSQDDSQIFDQAQIDEQLKYLKMIFGRTVDSDLLVSAGRLFITQLKSDDQTRYSKISQVLMYILENPSTPENTKLEWMKIVLEKAESQIVEDINSGITNPITSPLIVSEPHDSPLGLSQALTTLLRETYLRWMKSQYAQIRLFGAQSLLHLESAFVGNEPNLKLNHESVVAVLENLVSLTEAGEKTSDDLSPLSWLNHFIVLRMFNENLKIETKQAFLDLYPRITTDGPLLAAVFIYNCFMGDGSLEDSEIALLKVYFEGEGYLEKYWEALQEGSFLEYYFYKRAELDRFGNVEHTELHALYKIPFRKLKALLLKGDLKNKLLSFLEKVIRDVDNYYTVRKFIDFEMSELRQGLSPEALQSLKKIDDVIEQRKNTLNLRQLTAQDKPISETDVLNWLKFLPAKIEFDKLSDSDQQLIIQIVSSNKTDSKALVAIINWSRKSSDGIAEAIIDLGRDSYIYFRLLSHPNTPYEFKLEIAKIKAHQAIVDILGKEDETLTTILAQLSFLKKSKEQSEAYQSLMAQIEKLDPVKAAKVLIYAIKSSGDYVPAEYIKTMADKVAVWLDGNIDVTEKYALILAEAISRYAHGSVYNASRDKMILKLKQVRLRIKDPELKKEIDNILIEARDFNYNVIQILSLEIKDQQLSEHFSPAPGVVPPETPYELKNLLEDGSPLVREKAAQDARWLIIEKGRQEATPAPRAPLVNRETQVISVQHDDLLQTMALLARSTLDSDGPTRDASMGSLSVGAFFLEERHINGATTPTLFAAVPNDSAHAMPVIPDEIRGNEEETNLYLRHWMYKNMAIIPIQSSRTFSNDELSLIIHTLNRLPSPLLQGLTGIYGESENSGDGRSFAEEKFIHLKGVESQRTFYHELAHLIWRNIMTEDQRKLFEQIYNDALKHKDKSLTSEYAGKNVQEDFGEHFARLMMNGRQQLANGLQLALDGYPESLEMTLIIFGLISNNGKIFINSSQKEPLAENVERYKGLSVSQLTLDFELLPKELEKDREKIIFKFNDKNRLLSIGNILIFAKK